MAHHDHHAAPLLAAIAQEIRDVRVLMENIADIIVADEALVMTYVEQLQSFDLAIQRSDESAALLDRMAAGTKAKDAIKAVRLTAIQDKFAKALDTGRKHHGAAV